MNAWVTCERDFVAFASAGAEALKIMRVGMFYEAKVEDKLGIISEAVG
ncbi:MAG: hypothetical protein LUE90_00940 [Clostridiales bacterium]|nr:hypothetical protein [Clostridiales bacterium]